MIELLERDGKAGYMAGTTAGYMAGTTAGGPAAPRRVHNMVIGSNTIALQAAVDMCHSLSVIPVVLTSGLSGNATQVRLFVYLELKSMSFCTMSPLSLYQCSLQAILGLEEVLIRI